MGREMTLRRALREPGRHYDADPRGLPAVARPAHRERAGGGRPRADLERGGVLLAPGRRAGARGGGAGQGEPAPRPRVARRGAEHRRPAHDPRARGAQAAQGALRRQGLRHRDPALGAPTRSRPSAASRSSTTGPTWAPTTWRWPTRCSTAWAGAPSARGWPSCAPSSCPRRLTHVSELLRKPAVELARMVREGEVTSRELVEASLARIEATEALNHWTLARRRQRAGGRRRGRARATSARSRACRSRSRTCSPRWPACGWRRARTCSASYTPDYDYALVRRFKDAGFVIVGKTQTPEFGILPVTEPRRFGPARNPWDPERTTGGSSGGVGRRGGLGRGAGRPRQRRRRLDPDPRRLLRPGGAQAHARPDLARARPGRPLPRPPTAR